MSHVKRFFIFFYPPAEKQPRGQIGSYLLRSGRHDTSFRRAFITRNQLAVLFLYRRFQPALDAADHPLLRRVFLYRP